ncbi:MAG: GTP cyclohydrolase I FolE [Candidatus Omnitrophica bacterium CG11_big_fil_rev_8_21_14_0_20_63_9]|nr:MAG: GTP cyclohydrolase I FolE [Candidatus Omnitrophica bacterium CG11_big_fil_rev_8_21_14_0_20_63_9]
MSDEELRRLTASLEIPRGQEWEGAVRLLLTLMGEDPKREGLRRTPYRVKKALQFLTSGYKQNPAKILNRCFNVKQDEMVIVKDIDFFSLCEHHLTPFFGRCHVAYMPDKRIIGLSKIPRLVDTFARRLQVQERLTTQIAEAIQEHVKPLGVAVVVEASHLCMMMRGVQKQNSRAVTSSMLGVFRSSEKTRGEFLTLIRLPLAS